MESLERLAVRLSAAACFAEEGGVDLGVSEALHVHSARDHLHVIPLQLPRPPVHNAADTERAGALSEAQGPSGEGEREHCSRWNGEQWTQNQDNE